MTEELDAHERLEEWQSIVDILADLCEVPSAIITRVDPPQIEVYRASRGEENPYRSGQRVDLANHYCEEVINSRRRLLVEDARKSERWMSAPEIEYGIVSYLGYPVAWPDGEIFGTICILDNKENRYNSRYEALPDKFRGLIEAHLELQVRNRELREQFEEIRRLRGLIPICSGCKRIKNDAGYWEQLESYLHLHSEADFTHSLCPECMKRLYPEFIDSERGTARGT